MMETVNTQWAPEFIFFGYALKSSIPLIHSIESKIKNVGNVHLATSDCISLKKYKIQDQVQNLDSKILQIRVSKIRKLGVIMHKGCD